MGPLLSSRVRTITPSFRLLGFHLSLGFFRQRCCSLYLSSNDVAGSPLSRHNLNLELDLLKVAECYDAMAAKNPVSLNLDTSQIQQLGKIAEAEDCSVSRIVRRAVDKYLKESAKR